MEPKRPPGVLGSGITQHESSNPNPYFKTSMRLTFKLNSKYDHISIDNNDPITGVLLSVGVCVRYVHKHGMYGMYDDEDALCMLRLDAAALIAMNVACIMLPAVLLICATVILKGNMCRCVCANAQI